MFRLALALGRTVEELLESISYDELVTWADFYQREPWGQWADNVRNAHLIATLANINRDPKKRDKPFGLDEFMLFKLPEKPQPVQTEGAYIAPETLTYLFAVANRG